MSSARPVLRNRNEHKDYVQAKGPSLVPTSMFNKQPTIDPLFQDFLEDMKNRLPSNLNKEEKKAIIHELNAAFKKHGGEIKKLMDDPEVTQVIEQLKESLPTLPKEKNDEYALSSFISHLGKTLISAQLSASFPLLAAAASICLPAVAAQWQIHEGIPEGGLDLCANFLLGCIKGFLTNGSEPWSPKMPQFNRLVQEVDKKVAETSAYQTWKSCMNVDVVGGLTAQAHDTGVGGSLIPCSAQSLPWKGYQVSTQATNMPADACNAFSNLVGAKSQECASALANLGNKAAIVGGVLGGIAGLACVCCICFVVARKVMDYKYR